MYWNKDWNKARLQISWRKAVKAMFLGVYIFLCGLGFWRMLSLNLYPLTQIRTAYEEIVTKVPAGAITFEEAQAITQKAWVFYEAANTSPLLHGVLLIGWLAWVFACFMPVFIID